MQQRENERKKTVKELQPYESETPVAPRRRIVPNSEDEDGDSEFEDDKRRDMRRKGEAAERDRDQTYDEPMEEDDEPAISRPKRAILKPKQQKYTKEYQTMTRSNMRTRRTMRRTRRTTRKRKNKGRKVPKSRYAHRRRRCSAPASRAASPRAW